MGTFSDQCHATGTCLAQSEKNKDEQQKFYRLDFVIKEIAYDKVVNARSYSTMISTGHSGDQIRVGNKIPRQTGSPTNPYEYIDVGVSIDCVAPPAKLLGAGWFRHSCARISRVLM